MYGEIQLVYGGKLRRKFSLDTFFDGSKKSNTNLSDKLIEVGFRPWILISIILFFIYVLLLVFPKHIIPVVKILLFSLKLWLKGFFPVSKYNFCWRIFFRSINMVIILVKILSSKKMHR